MFKYIALLLIVASLSYLLVACGEKTSSEKLSDAAKAVTDDLVDAADDAGDAVSDAAHDVEDAARKATK